MLPHSPEHNYESTSFHSHLNMDDFHKRLAEAEARGNNSPLWWTEDISWYIRWESFNFSRKVNEIVNQKIAQWVESHTHRKNRLLDRL